MVAPALIRRRGLVVPNLTTNNTGVRELDPSGGKGQKGVLSEGSVVVRC